MQSTYLALFVAGLALNVYFVIRGTERWSRRDLSNRVDALGRELRLGRVSLKVPVAASFSSVFGLTGYLLGRSGKLYPGVVGAAALALAALAVASAVLLVRKWAVPNAIRDAPDDRFVLQGQLARVIEAIPSDSEGEVSYEIDDRRFTTRAQSVDGSAIETGADVVIERVENGVVFVEPWTRVEQRL